MAKKGKQEEAPRKKFAGLIAGLKDSLSKKQDELDKAGIERKAMELSPDIIEGLRTGLVEKLPEDEDAVEDILTLIVEVLSSEQPESDVEDETAAFGEEDEDEKAEDDEEEEKQVAALTTQVAEMGKAYNDLIEDVSEVVQLTHKAFDKMNAETKSYNDVTDRLGAIEKQLKKKPRRASQSPETELDPESELAKSIKSQQGVVPDGYQAFSDMFEGGAS